MPQLKQFFLPELIGTMFPTAFFSLGSKSCFLLVELLLADFSSLSVGFSAAALPFVQRRCRFFVILRAGFAGR